MEKLGLREGGTLGTPNPLGHTRIARLLVQPESAAAAAAEKPLAPGAGVCAQMVTSHVSLCGGVSSVIHCPSSWKITIRNGLWPLMLDSSKWPEHFWLRNCSHLGATVLPPHSSETKSTLGCGSMRNGKSLACHPSPLWQVLLPLY